MKLIRMTDEPVLKPIKEHDWEKSAVFNAALVYENDLFHMIYRATDIGGSEKYGRYINSLGYAVSSDMLTWKRRTNPVLKNNVPQEARGPEDPRIVKIEDKFYMNYTGFKGDNHNDYRICLATSTDLIHWERQGVVLDEPNKDAAIFPKKIGGLYWMFHRRSPDIWIAHSKDLKEWTGHQRIVTPRPGKWDSLRIGIAGPPLLIDDGWLLLYHGVDEHHVYRLGVMLLDRNDPTRVIAHQDDPIIEPELEWEINGYVPNVIFSCGAVIQDGQLYCCYGGADTVIGVARIAVKDIKF